MKNLRCCLVEGRNKEGSDMKFGESSSESTSKKHVFQAPEVSAQMKGSVEEEALTAMCFGKEVNDENILEERVGTRSLEDNELAGGVFEEASQRPNAFF
ncbi:hypothetical protein V6N13_131935 [Hibiscus sabdariffa]